MTHDADSHSKAEIIDLDPEQVVDQGREAESVQHAAAPAKTSSRRFVLWAASGLVIAAIGGGWLYRDFLAPYLPSDALATANTRLAALETENKSLREEVSRVAKLANSLGEGVNALEVKTTAAATAAEQIGTLTKSGESRIAKLDQTIAGVKAAVDELKARPSTLPASSSGSVDSGVLAQLSARIETLEKDVASLKTQTPSGAEDVSILSQSLADLRAKIAAGTGYAAELDRIQRLVPAAPGLDILAPYAEHGIPDAKGLAAELMSLADALPKPDQPAKEESGTMFSNVWQAISGLVRIRNLGDIDWPTAAKSAASLADRGELRSAIEQLGAIEGSKPAGLTQWLERAEARLRIEQSAHDVGEAVMRAIAAKG